MAAKGEDTLTQIQKYKAMLSSKRNKGDEKAIRKPKKKRLRKGNVETGLETVLTVSGLATANDKETSSNSQAEKNLKEENVDTNKLETNTVLSQESKQGPELPSTNDGELVGSKSTITSAGDHEPTDKASELVEDRPPACDKKEEQVKKEKSKGLSLRRKRKKSKKKHKETEDKAQAVENEENYEEKFSWNESAPELGDVSVAPSSPETKQDESLCEEMSPGQKLEKNEESGNDNKPKEGAEGKEKISRAQKFKRWASFTKQKKVIDSVVIEKEQFDLETSKSTKSSIEDSDSLDDGASERKLISESLPGEKVEDMENSVKEETVNDQKELECPSLPEKQRRRSVSLNETTDKENDSLSPDNAQRTRSASFGKGNTITLLTASFQRENPRKKSQEKKVSVGQDNELPSSQNEGELTKLEIQNNEDVNEVENEQAIEQKANNSIVEEREQQFFDVSGAGDDKKEMQNAQSPMKDEQPKKKKKSFLRKISSKNLKVNKKDDNVTEEPKKLEISAPLLVKFESLTGSDVLNNSKPIEVSPEKPNKRKKSGLNLKLPKALKRVKSTEYKAIGGEEAEKEIERDEKFLQNNLEKSEEMDGDYEQSQDEESQEKVQESVENDKVAGSEESNSEYRKVEENAVDGKVYSFCRALMNDVLKELLDHMTKTEQEESPSGEDEDVRATNEMLTSITEELKTIGKEKKVNDETKEEEEKYCKELTHYADESSVPRENKEMAGEESSELATTVKEEELEKPKENIDDMTEEKDEENEMDRGSNDESESQDIENNSQETKEKIVEESKEPEDEPKEPEDEPIEPEDEAKHPDEMSTLPEGEPNILEEKSQPNDVTTQFEDEVKQSGEEMSTHPEGEPNILEEKSQPDDVANQFENEVKQSEEMPARPASEGEPEESDDTLQQEQDNQVSEQNESQSSEASFEKSANELQPAEDKAMASEGTSNFYGNEVSVLERSIEVSMKTQALVDSYILIDHSLQLSQEFLKRVELMDLNYSNKRKPRCSIM